MDPRERQVIDDLFGKLRQVEQQAPQRDREAEQYIQQQVTGQASAPYYMAQAMLVQERALNGMQQRVQELERQLAERPAAGGGGFLAGLFGGQQAAPAAPPPGQRMAPQAQPYPAGAAYQQPGAMAPGMAAAPYGSPWARPAGGGFLAGAMQTALGVAGGMLVADAISSAFSSGTAAADEIAHQAQAGVADAAAETPFLSEAAPDPMAQDVGYQEDFADSGMDEGYEEI